MPAKSVSDSAAETAIDTVAEAAFKTRRCIRTSSFNKDRTVSDISSRGNSPLQQMKHHLRSPSFTMHQHIYGSSYGRPSIVDLDDDAVITISQPLSEQQQRFLEGQRVRLALVGLGSCHQEQVTKNKKAARSAHKHKEARLRKKLNCHQLDRNNKPATQSRTGRRMCHR